ncbi:MAG: YoaP domain-containing protein [Spirochaetales bacterium]|nr:YoaP domain-containing protein [Spirochaetales bacterium]
MEIIKLDESNIQSEHICCAISDKKCVTGVYAKKNLIKQALPKGWTFSKLNVRGKVFIEYQPAEESWLPLNGDGYTAINCFWVSGQYKGKGWGKKLLGQCLDDSESKAGVIAVSSDKKRPFLSDPVFLRRQGFEVVDEAEPYFKLWCRKNDNSSPDPQFLDSARRGECVDNGGLTVYYSDFCPFPHYWNTVVLSEYAEQMGIPLDLHKIESRADGRRTPVPWIINSVFFRGKFLTQEIKIDKILEKKMNSR